MLRLRPTSTVELVKLAVKLAEFNVPNAPPGICRRRTAYQSVRNDSRQRQNDSLGLRGCSKPVRTDGALDDRRYFSRLQGSPADLPTLPAPPTHAGDRVRTKIHQNCCTDPDFQLIGTCHGGAVKCRCIERVTAPPGSSCHGACLIQCHLSRDIAGQRMHVSEIPGNPLQESAPAPQMRHTSCRGRVRVLWHRLARSSSCLLFLSRNFQ